MTIKSFFTFLLASAVSGIGISASPKTPSPMLMDLRITHGVPADSVGVEISVDASSKIEAPVFIARGYQFRKMRELHLPLPAFDIGANRVRVFWNQLPSDPELLETLTAIHFNELEIISDNGSPVDARLISWDYIKGPAGTAEQPAWNCIKQRDFSADSEGWRAGIPVDGFGRFGWLPSSGLLVGSLHSDGFEVRAITETGENLHGVWQVRLGDASLPIWERTRTDWTTVEHTAFYDYAVEMKNELAAKAPQLLKETRQPQRLLGSVLAPGFLIDSNARSLVLTPGIVRDDPTKSKSASKVKAEAYSGRQDIQPRIFVPTREGNRWLARGEELTGDRLSEGWLVAVWPGREAMPILLVLQKIPSRVKVENEDLQITFSEALGRVGVSYPAGYRAWNNGSDQSLAEKSRKLAAIMRAYPVGCTQQFRITEAGNAVEIRETFRHLIWDNAWAEPANRIAPVAPLLSFAADNDYPLTLPKTRRDMDWPTKTGPYMAVPGGEVVYTLPIPPTGTRLYLRPEGVDPMADGIAKELLAAATLREDIWLRTDCLRSWWMWAPSSLALPLFDEEQRAEYLRRWRWTIDHNLLPHVWYSRTEPFSGARYPVSFGWVEGTTRTLGDINSGLGAVLYGVWSYARSSGDWELVKERWPVIRGAIEYFIVQHDWCHMQSGAREHSGSSAIDMDGIGYEGVVAFTAMAEALGRDDDAALGRLLVARLAVPTVVRWLGQKWIQPNQKHEDWERIGVGLSEVWGFDFLGAKEGGPDYVASELALSLSWAGQFPELYKLHLWGLGDDFWRWFQDDYIENKIEDWRKNHPGHRNNHSANITAHLYMRSLLGASSAILRDELQKQKNWGMVPKKAVAQENAGFYALMIGREFPVSLLSWGYAGVKKAEYSMARREAVLEFQSEQSFPLVLELSQNPKAVTINDSVVSRINIVRKQITLNIPAGNSRVILQFP